MVFPGGELGWLGLWFTPSFNTSPHFAKRLALAQGAFVAIKRLSPPGMGLPPYLCHHLSVSLLFPILSYGGDVFVPNAQALTKLSTFWHAVQRWVTCAFSSTPLDILSYESCLPPVALLLSHKRRLAALRVLCSPPEINPVSAGLSPSVPAVSPHRFSPDSRLLLVGQSGSHLPLKWTQPCPPSLNRSHLPIDALAHSILGLLEGHRGAPLPLISAHLVDYAPRPLMSPGLTPSSRPVATPSL